MGGIEPQQRRDTSDEAARAVPSDDGTARFALVAFAAQRPGARRTH